MYYKSNKAQSNQIPVLKVIFIILLVTGSFISAILILYPLSSYTIDERKINTQLVISRSLESNCFSDKYSKLNLNLFTQEKIDECFQGITENTLLRIGIDDKYYYVNDKKDEFNTKANLCSYSSTILCTQMNYPIILIDEQNKQTLNTIKLQIITT